VTTLFRYPGPFALAEALMRGPPPLAPGRWIWLSDDPLVPLPGPVRRFGSLAVLAAERLGLDTVDAHTFLAAAQPVGDEQLVWLPPSRLEVGRALLAGARTREEASRLLGDTDDERADVLAELGAYLEELTALERAGAPPPGRAWCDVEAEERRRRLAEHGIHGRWSVGDG
jgi:hypothetical protein